MHGLFRHGEDVVVVVVVVKAVVVVVVDVLDCDVGPVMRAVSQLLPL